MSEMELLEAEGAWWSPVVGVLLLIVFCFAIWAVMHAPLIWQRGRAYRARLRAARHRQPMLPRQWVSR